MSQNPYAQFGQQGGNLGQEDFEPMPSRTSILAVMSLVIGIIAVIPGICCIPGPGVIAVLLGGISALLIGRSLGRLTGMGLAITGIVLGLLASVFSVFVLIGASSINEEASAQFFKPAAATLRQLEAGDHPTLRKALTPEASAKVTDQQIVDFVANYKTSLGSFKSAPEDIIDVIRSFMKLAETQNQANQRFGQPGQNFIPIPAEFSQGRALVIILFEPASMGKAKTPSSAPGAPATLGPIAVNIGILTLDGKEIWLWDLDESRKLMVGSGGGPRGMPGLPPPPPPPPPPSGSAPTDTKPPADIDAAPKTPNP